MKSIIGEIWEIPHRRVIINGDDGKDYVLLCDQKIRYIFFPFLLWMRPLEFIEVKKGSFDKTKIINQSTTFFGACLMNLGAILSKISDRTLINIPIPTSYYWTIALGLGLSIRIIFRNNRRPKNIVAIHHAKLKPLRRYYVMRALIAVPMSIGLMWIFLWVISSPAAQGQIILLAAATCMAYIMMWFNFPFVNVAKAKITFLD